MHDETGGPGSPPEEAGARFADRGTRPAEPGTATGHSHSGGHGSFLSRQPATLALLALAVLAVTSVAVLGLIGPQGGAPGSGQGEWRGLVLPEPLEKAEFTLTDTEGRAFRFREETDGYVTLLFFGYTHCPDVCPLHMANLAAVLRDLPEAVRSRVKVVFVTTDPERDTPERIREWLDAFDPSFIGLWGPLDQVNEIQAAFGLPPAVKQEVPGGDYLVGHAAYVLAFTTDNRAHLLYPSGTRQADWAHDLPRLVRRGEDGS